MHAWLNASLVICVKIIVDMVLKEGDLKLQSITLCRLMQNGDKARSLVTIVYMYIVK